MEAQIRWLTLMVFIAWSVAGCSGSLPRHSLGKGAFPTGFYIDQARPELALLEYRIGKYLAEKQRPYRTICAVSVQFDRSDPDSKALPLNPEVERKLLARFLDLSPSTECNREGLGYVDSATGAPAAAFDVHGLECVTASICTAWGGYYAVDEHGWGFYEIRWNQSGWNLVGKNPGIVLTSPAFNTAQPSISQERRLAVDHSPAGPFGRIEKLVIAADTIVIGSIMTVNNRHPLADGNRTTVAINVERQFKGAPRSTLSLRFGEGYNRDGSLAQIAGSIRVLQSLDPSIRSGQRVVIFASERSYLEGSKARGGTPIAGSTQAIAIFAITDSTALSVSDSSLFFDISTLEMIGEP